MNQDIEGKWSETSFKLADIMRSCIGMQDFDRLIRLSSLLMDTGDIPGDVVEFGCNVGRTAVLMASLMAPGKKIWLYDSFEGLPDIQPSDGADPVQFQKGSMACDLNLPGKTFDTAGLPKPIVHKGWFEDLPPDDLPGQISFVHADGDLYSSVIASLNIAFPRMSPGSICVIDDINLPALPGAMRAALEFTKMNRLTLHTPLGVGGQPCLSGWFIKAA